MQEEKAQEVMKYMRRNGPFEPHSLGLEDMEYTTLPEVMIKHKKKFKKVIISLLLFYSVYIYIL